MPHGTRAIVTFSNRPFACQEQHWTQMRAYADQVNASWHLVTDLHGPEFRRIEGRCDLMSCDGCVRFAKYAMMPYYLERYDNVALVDDSIVLSSDLSRVLNLFSRPARSVVGTLDASIISHEHCDHYSVPRDQCMVGRRMINSGLLVFSRKHHLHLFDEPCETWQKAGGFFDQALFNAVIMKQRVPIYDLNSGKEGCSERVPALPAKGDEGCDALESWLEGVSTCFLLFGSQLKTLVDSNNLDRATASSCIAHVTRGAALESEEQRDQLRCNVSSNLGCDSWPQQGLRPRLRSLDQLPRLDKPWPQQGGDSLMSESYNVSWTIDDEIVKNFSLRCRRREVDNSNK